MEYYAIYEITGIGNKEIIGYVAPAQNAIERLAANANDVPAMSAIEAAGQLGRRLAKNDRWIVMKNDAELVGASYGNREFYNDSCIDNFAILNAMAERLAEITAKLAKRINPKPNGKPSRTAKIAGFESLNELSEITGESVQTLNNWYKNNTRRFALIVKGAQTEKLI